MLAAMAPDLAPKAKMAAFAPDLAVNPLGLCMATAQAQQRKCNSAGQKVACINLPAQE
jgi:hypothetical protein